MLRLVSDENFNGDIVRGLLLRHPALNLCRVQDVGLEEADDPTILAWAATTNRIVLTHNHATMPDFAYARVVAGQPMPGVFVMPDRMAVRQAIEELLLVEACSEQASNASGTTPVGTGGVRHVCGSRSSAGWRTAGP
jgi:predicted nuclease of predicted toxin-antitoxin system